jgi:hypothetical protein
MEVSSELPLAVDSVPPVWLVETAPPVESYDCEDQEFPPDLPTSYDWMLQPASRRASRRALRVVVVMVTVLLIAGSFLVVRWLPRSIPSVLASPSSSSSSSSSSLR